jgi:hypothetical protein
VTYLEGVPALITNMLISLREGEGNTVDFSKIYYNVRVLNKDDGKG